MNARHNKFEFTLEGRQIQEAITGLFHTILFFRSTGKYQYNSTGTSYGIGTIGFEDITCDFLDFTYIRATSAELIRDLCNEIQVFVNLLRSCEGNGGVQEGQISLEFYQKKKNYWPFNYENIPWEIWMVKINIINLPNEAERQRHRCSAGEELADAVYTITQTMNRNDYVPRARLREDLDLIFETKYSDIQPYLFKVGYQTNLEPASPSIPSAVRRIFRDTFAI